jgi:branched-chain amino acid transport system permease protein
MMKKIRRSVDDVRIGIRNFLHWLPKSIKHTYSEIPSSLRRFRFWAYSFRGKLTIASFIGLILLSFVTSDYIVSGILITAMIYAIFAASWDLLAGYAGQVSFGHSVFFGLAGYFTAAFVKFQGYHWIIALFIGAFASVGFSLLIGIPCLRLKGPYLALGTLAFSLILFNLFMMGELADWLWGTEGISGLPAMTPYVRVTFIIVLGFMVFSFVIMRIVVNSKLGTVFKSIRDDETCAEASGINTTKYKLVAFMISGFFAGIAGALYTLTSRAVNPAFYQPLYSFYAIVMASIGGLASISGSILGAFLFQGLSELLRPLAATAFLIFATVLILIVRFAEEGVLSPLGERLEQLWDIIRGR